jgi:hypothetical protein
MAVGALDSLQAMREVIARSVELEHYLPGDSAPWEQWDQ